MQKSLGEFIAELRKARGMTQQELANALGVHQTFVSALESGRKTGLSTKSLHRLCEICQVPLDTFAPYLAPGVTVPPPPVATFQVRPVDIPQQPPIPIVGSVGAGPPLDDPIYDQVLDFTKLFAGDMAAYIVEGDSMRDAHILDGDTIICRRTPVPLPGEEVVAWLDDHNGCVIKTFQGGRATLGWLTSDDGWRHDLTAKDVVYGALVSIIRSKRTPAVKKPKKKGK